MGAQVEAVFEEWLARVPGRTVEYRAIDYTAAELSTVVYDLPGFLRSADVGALLVKTLIESRRDECPNERFVLVGYSQGAMAVDAAVRSLGVEADPYLLDSIDAAVLLANPLRFPEGGANQLGSAPDNNKKEGIAWALANGKKTVMPGRIAPRVYDVCNENDPVCDISPADAKRLASVAEGGRLTPPALMAIAWASANAGVHTDSYMQSDSLHFSALAAAGHVRDFPVPATPELMLPADRSITIYTDPGQSEFTQQLEIVEDATAEHYWTFSDPNATAGLTLTPDGVLSGPVPDPDTQLILWVHPGAPAATSALPTSISQLRVTWASSSPNAATAVGAGEYFTCALTEAGAVMCWGDNAEGQLGDGTQLRSSLPVAVTGLGTGVVAISVGSTHACALTEEGGAKCWGDNDHGELGRTGGLPSVPEDVVGLSSGVAAVSAGHHFTCALMETGAVKCWGHNVNGALGDGTSIAHSTVPVDVIGLSSGVEAISTGGSHACALMDTAAVKCWGSNHYGALGAPTGTTFNPTPVDVVAYPSGAAVVRAGKAVTCVIEVDGGATKCWGWDAFGQLGNGSAASSATDPPPVLDLGAAASDVAMAANGSHSCALLADESLACWGWNLYGALGNGTTTNSDKAVAVDALLAAPRQVSAGSVHTCAVDDIGRIACWGYNAYGQLGTGDTTNTTVPSLVQGIGPDV